MLLYTETTWEDNLSPGLAAFLLSLLQIIAQLPKCLFARCWGKIKLKWRVDLSVKLKTNGKNFSSGTYSTAPQQRRQFFTIKNNSAAMAYVGENSLSHSTFYWFSWGLRRPAPLNGILSTSVLNIIQAFRGPLLIIHQTRPLVWLVCSLLCYGTAQINEPLLEIHRQV